MSHNNSDKKLQSRRGVLKQAAAVSGGLLASGTVMGGRAVAKQQRRSVGYMRGVEEGEVHQVRAPIRPANPDFPCEGEDGKHKQVTAYETDTEWNLAGLTPTTLEADDCFEVLRVIMVCDQQTNPERPDMKKIQLAEVDCPEEPEAPEEGEPLA